MNAREEWKKCIRFATEHRKAQMGLWYKSVAWEGHQVWIDAFEAKADYWEAVMAEEKAAQLAQFFRNVEA